ncbi:MAG: PSD1 domain-containing protein [Planctomycetales bacterium]|nr:PSD1 domain-containing protein [Planctomycetales bacterium]
MFLVLFAAARVDAEQVDFARRILPILSNKCFVCHGPDTQDPAMLRLDSAESATAPREGGRAIDPDNPQHSLALARLRSKDNPMPPADAEKQLTDEERALLIRWIESGGDYRQHWAFVPPAKVDTAGAVSTRDAVDALLLRKLDAEKPGTGFAEHASKEVLARRVALVLTGLPPEPELLARYLQDSSDAAYSQLVDELLESPRFGEHQARYWLDAVRYGDTHGLHLDNRRGIYPYRDWVVRAFNENLPLNDFIVWQLAGDLLPESSLEQLVATGFVRMNPTTSEGGAIPDEFQAKNNFDRVETLGTVLLGMTFTCARCHSHKYDPISQTDYYRLLAFFNSTAESPMDGNAYEYGPIAKAPPHYDAWDQWRSVRAGAVVITGDPRVSRIAAREAVEYAKSAGQWKSSEWRWAPGPLTASSDASSPDPSTALPGLPGESSVKFPPAKAGESRFSISAALSSPVAQRLRLTLRSQDQPVGNVNDTSVSLERAGGDLWQADIELPAGESRLQCQVSAVPDKPVLAKLESHWSEFGKAAWPTLSIENQLQLVADPLGPFATLGLGSRAALLAGEFQQLQSQFVTTLIARDLPQARPTRLLKRGEYNLPTGDPLSPSVPPIMGEWPRDAPNNRLGLARWLTSREHPLVSRVLVNLVWQRVFGAGLVRSPEDFGLQGQQPTHPELLDWLAVDLHDSGWNHKQLLRELVHTRAFQQSSAWRPELDDPQNTLWARGPGYRLDAEVLRDVGLWASGLLDPHMGGEGVKPYQPDGMWRALAHPASNTKQYVRDEGAKLYRRSLYVYWKRTSPHPMMTLFDAPDRESSCVRRSRTNTALQSLGLLNETQRVEMARTLAQRLIRSGTDDRQRLKLLFQLLACRDAKDVERDACLQLLEAMKTRYASAPDDAMELLKTGEAARDEQLAPAEHAAWTLVAATVLASDIAILLY